RDVLRESGNFIQIFEDYPTPGRSSIVTPLDAALFDAWETYIYQQPEGVVCTELNQPTEVRLLEIGPVRAKIQ
ncbi:MAG: hypothetical protein GTN65_18420, partial [Armatimonadetes bacterium]|nr:hypothetical protein [Armatimonadota bacterium]NIO99010.1 hypothetical protein [Armatimonadota bacterium]